MHTRHGLDPCVSRVLGARALPVFAESVLAQEGRDLELGLFEVNEAAEVVTGAADQNANVIFGAVIDDALGDEVRVTVIATGFGTRMRRRRLETPVAQPVAAIAGERSERPERRELTDTELEIPSFLRED